MYPCIFFINSYTLAIPFWVPLHKIYDPTFVSLGIEIQNFRFICDGRKRILHFFRPNALRMTMKWPSAAKRLRRKGSLSVTPFASWWITVKRLWETNATDKLTTKLEKFSIGVKSYLVLSNFVRTRSTYLPILSSVLLFYDLWDKFTPNLFFVCSVRIYLSYANNR